ncbi:MAG: hypothetical protein QXM58_02105 [Candidatus Micrarchaeaceae archaeon]
MLRNKKQIEDEILRIKQEISELSSKASQAVPDASSDAIAALTKYLIEERERTNRVLNTLTEQIRSIEERLGSGNVEEVPTTANVQGAPQSREIPLSEVDTNVLLFVQSKGMVCADDLKEAMHYKGKNAACARLNRLYQKGIIERFQLGHKVYYKYDAGKAINTLIISPPQ